MDFIGGNLITFLAGIGGVLVAFLGIRKLKAYPFGKKLLPENVMPQLFVCGTVVLMVVVVLEAPASYPAWLAGIAGAFLGITGLVED